MTAAASPAASAYAVAVADLHEDRAAVLDVWRTYMSAPPEGKFEWFYLRHPVEPPTLLLLTHVPQGLAVGVAGLGTRRVCVQGDEGTAGILADLVVRAEHRSLYPALLLQKEMRRTAMGLHGIVYGIPNASSAPIVRRLGYTKVGDMVRYAKVLRYGPHLQRRLPSWAAQPAGALADRLLPLYYRPYRALRQNWQCTWTEDFDERFDALWQGTRGFDGLIGVRDAQFLSWRFLSQPGQRYRVFVVTRRGEAQITAYAVCRADASTLQVVDFLATPSAGDHERLLIHLLAREAVAQGFATLSLEFMGSPQLHRTLAAAGFVEREKRPLYASFAEQDEARLLKLDWYVTGADEDQ